jgi:hypothetical protein
MSHAFHYKRMILIFFLITFSTGFVSAQERILDVGARFQKSVNLYHENGVSLAYSDPNVLSDRLYFGLAYVSSRFGSAIGSNALKQDNFLFSGTWYFRPDRLIRPLGRINIGYFTADYEADIFDDLPNKSLLLSLEGGLGLSFRSPLRASLTLGYNLITGNGVRGPGTIYPVYLQSTIAWSILKKN